MVMLLLLLVVVAVVVAEGAAGDNCQKQVDDASSDWQG